MPTLTPEIWEKMAEPTKDSLLESIRSGTPAEVFRREYQCEFLPWQKQTAKGVKRGDQVVFMGGRRSGKSMMRETILAELNRKPENWGEFS